MSAPSPGLCRKCGRLGTFMRVAGASGWKVTAWCLGHDGLVDPNRAWWPVRDFDTITLGRMPVRASRLDATDSCSVCGVTGPVEAHHLAPVEMFGRDADLWPVIDVCRTCHEVWHARMGHPIGHHPPVVK